MRDRQHVPAQPITLDVRLLHRDAGPQDRHPFTRARALPRRPHNLARPIFVSGVVDALTDQVVETMGANVVGGSNLLSREDIADIRDELRADPDVQRAIADLWPELRPEEVLADLLTSPQRLATAAPDLPQEDRDALLRDPTVAEFSPRTHHSSTNSRNCSVSTTPPNGSAPGSAGVRRSRMRKAHWTF